MDYNMPLGRLERVDLRAVWLNEAGHFTPWLAREDNLSLLADTIGLDLVLESTEERVGPFRADILCKDTISDNWVLIENQIERTDHSHLGQLLTYAAGLSAVTIVWIAERFTDEHRAALDWLNEVTDEDINLFGLEIELWRIGNSHIAPKFNIVSQPNDWTKQVSATRQQAQSGEPTESDRLRLEFWTAFQAHLEDSNSFLKSRKPNMRHWMNFAIGRSKFRLAALVSMRDGFLAVNLIMTGANAKVNYRLLEREREVIEAEIGEELEWRELPNHVRSDVHLYLRNVDPTDKNQWPVYHEWLKQKVEAFHRTFAPRIKSLDPDDYVASHGLETDEDESLQ